MQPCKSILMRTGVFFLFLIATFLTAALPAYGQRGTADLDFGITGDKYGSQPQTTAADFGASAQYTLIRATKDGGPNIVVGGEFRTASDTSNHPVEFAVFGGPIFPIGNLSIGVNAEVRKILQPHAELEGTLLDRYNLELLEIPLIIKYKFGPDHRAFIQLQGQPEFTPHYKTNLKALEGVPHPDFDHGYTVRGTLGYNFGKWYLKGTYETRYFRFVSNAANPLNFYNWHSNNITAGIGLNF
jgi:hypothetical protein